MVVHDELSPGELSDAELLALVRVDDERAMAELHTRHHQSATRFARRLAGHSHADDLVSEAYVRVFAKLRAGGGPDVAFRPYLLTTVRNLYVDLVRSDSKLYLVEDASSLGEQMSVGDGADSRVEQDIIFRAFKSLPVRWQLVLWHTAVEGQSPAEAGLHLGLGKNAVSALSFRARDGLRRAYLAEHLGEVSQQACRQSLELLPSYVRAQLSRRQRAIVDDHLDECTKCAAAYRDLRSIERGLGAILAPAVLGIGASVYLGSAGQYSAVTHLLGVAKKQARPLLAGVTSVAAALGFALALANDGPPYEVAKSTTTKLVPPAIRPRQTLPPEARREAKPTPEPGQVVQRSKPESSIAVVPPEVARTQTARASEQGVREPPTRRDFLTPPGSTPGPAPMASPPAAVLKVDQSIGALAWRHVGREGRWTHFELPYDGAGSQVRITLKASNLLGFRIHDRSSAWVCLYGTDPVSGGETSTVDCSLPAADHGAGDLWFDLELGGRADVEVEIGGSENDDADASNNVQRAMIDARTDDWSPDMTPTNPDSDS